MRVTNEQIQAALACRLDDDCSRCPFVWANTQIERSCNDLQCTDFDAYKDLLEARELIKEMREVLNATRKTYSNEILTLAKMRIDEVLEKTKDYA
jgi:hypothetical protein